MRAVIFFVVLAAGFAAGLVASLLVPGSRKLSLAATAVVGIVGAGVGLTLAELAGRGNVIARFVLAIACAVIVTLVAEAIVVRRRRDTSPARGARELIAEGETGTVEFKGSARRNRHTGARDERLELVIAKTIAGFLTAVGGTLLIGVADDGAVVGVDGDYSVTVKGNRDGLELWLRDYLSQRLGTESLLGVDVAFEVLDGVDVCRIDVAPSNRPVFLAEPGKQTADLYVRAGNSTRRLLTDEAITYVAERFPTAVGR
jgi:uncharacterized membrane protein YeaQ/YmgE (transglycosylase-associated protein family)